MALPLGLTAGLSAKVIDQNKVEWESRCLPHSVVFRMNGKAIKTDAVPQAVREHLMATMLIGVKQPSEPVPAQSEEQELTQAASAIEALEANDNTQEAADGVLPALGTLPQSQSPTSQTASVLPQPEATPASVPVAVKNITPQDDEDLGFSEDDAPTIDLAKELEEAEARSIDRVNLRQLAEVLYQRFGIYTVYLNRAPARSDISPLTGAVMNNLALGQANQHFKAAQRMGTSWSPSVIKSQIATARSMRKGHVALPTTVMDENQTVGGAYGQPLDTPNLHGEPRPRVNRHYESPHTSVMAHHRGKESEGLDEDEVYAEPPINARTAVVRPFFNNAASQEQLERISKTRVPKHKQNVSFDDII